MKNKFFVILLLMFIPSLVFSQWHWVRVPYLFTNDVKFEEAFELANGEILANSTDAQLLWTFDDDATTLGTVIWSTSNTSLSDNDKMVHVFLRAVDDSSGTTDWVVMDAVMTDESDESEDSKLVFKTYAAGTQTSILTLESATATFLGTVTVGSAGSGHDVQLFSATSGDHFLWDASEEALTIIGTNGQDALNIDDGNVDIADDVDIDGTLNVDDADFDLGSELNIDGELVCIGATGDGATADGDNDLIVKGDFEVDGTTDIDGAMSVAGKFNFNPDTELTISGDSITVTQNVHIVDTEGDAATDSVQTIVGGVEGMMLILSSASSDRDPTIVDGGNLLLSGDFAFSNVADRIVLIYDGTNWVQLSESDNQ